MKVSEEWRGHAHDLRRIAEMLKRRPTLNLNYHLSALDNLAEQIEREVDEYEAQYEAEVQDE